MRTYHVYEFRKINVFGYFVLFFALLITAGILVNYFTKYDNLTAIIFMLFIVVDGLICYALSIAAASKPLAVTVDDTHITFDRGADGATKMPLDDLVGFEIVEQRTTPKHLFVLTAGQHKIRMFGRGDRNGDFLQMEQYFASQPGVVTDEEENQPTAE